jgi:hypothetical protein
MAAPRGGPAPGGYPAASGGGPRPAYPPVSGGGRGAAAPPSDYNYASNRPGGFGGAAIAASSPSYSGPGGGGGGFGGAGHTRGVPGGGWGSSGGASSGGGFGAAAHSSSAAAAASAASVAAGHGSLAGPLGRVGGAATDKRYERGLVEELTAAGGVRMGACAREGRAQWQLALAAAPRNLLTAKPTAAGRLARIHRPAGGGGQSDPRIGCNLHRAALPLT